MGGLSVVSFALGRGYSGHLAKDRMDAGGLPALNLGNVAKLGILLWEYRLPL